MASFICFEQQVFNSFDLAERILNFVPDADLAGFALVNRTTCECFYRSIKWALNRANWESSAHVSLLEQFLHLRVIQDKGYHLRLVSSISIPNWVLRSGSGGEDWMKMNGRKWGLDVSDNKNPFRSFDFCALSLISYFSQGVLFGVSEKKQVQKWDVNRQKLLDSVPLQDSLCSISVLSQKDVFCWTEEDDLYWLDFEKHTYWCCEKDVISFDGYKGRLVVLTSDLQIHVWDMKIKRKLYAESIPHSVVNSGTVKASPDGRHVAICFHKDIDGLNRKEIVIWDMEEKKVVWQKAYFSAISRFGFFLDGKHFFIQADINFATNADWLKVFRFNPLNATDQMVLTNLVLPEDCRDLSFKEIAAKMESSKRSKEVLGPEPQDPSLRVDQSLPNIQVVYLDLNVYNMFELSSLGTGAFLRSFYYAPPSLERLSFVSEEDETRIQQVLEAPRYQELLSKINVLALVEKDFDRKDRKEIGIQTEAAATAPKRYAEDPLASSPKQSRSEEA